MVSGALKQLFQQTMWSDLDYLIVDLPPGTGDIQLVDSILPLTGAGCDYPTTISHDRCGKPKHAQEA